MTAPVCANIREVLETMRDAMIDLLFVRIRFVIRLADAFRDDLRVALGVAGIFAVLALHAGRVFEQVSTECTSHNVVELLLDKFVTLLFVDFFLLLPNRALSVQANIVGAFLTGLLLECHGKMNPTCWFQ